MERVLKEYGNAASRVFVLLLMCFCLTAHAQIYKVVDKDGNVTYTDQAPGDGTQPMDLPELSVVSTDYPEPAQQAVETASTEAEGEKELTRKELRKMYRSFRISRPEPEETFWGTENTVVVAWETGEALQEGMSVRFNIDGKPQPASVENMMGITLDRGTHTVSAALLDAGGNSIMTTDTVTFYVHQQTVRGNGP